MAPLTMDAIGKALRNAIRDDAAILAYCASEFGSAYAIYYTSGGRKGNPTQIQYPAFVLRPLNKDIGQGEAKTDRAYAFSLGLAIEDETQTETTDGNGVLSVEAEGPKVLEDLLDLARTAMRSVSTELFFSEDTMEMDETVFFPVFSAEVSMLITYPITPGFDPSL
jgi:hypothetical protein